MQKPKDTPYELLALLLLTVPVELTLIKLVVLPTLGERNHHGHIAAYNLCVHYIKSLYRSLSLCLSDASNFASVVIRFTQASQTVLLIGLFASVDRINSRAMSS